MGLRQFLSRFVPNQRTAKKKEYNGTFEESTSPADEDNMKQQENPSHKEQDESATESAKCRIVRGFQNDVNANLPFDQYQEKYFLTGSYYSFPNGHEIPAHEFADLFLEMRASFPDFHFSHEFIEELDDGTVRVNNVRASGTHTGKPYKVGPYEEVPATGIKCQNGPESMIFTFREGKVWRVDVIPHGQYSGPMGFYEQIGGLII